VPKPDGFIRFCNDFRQLNAISKFDAYPMPQVDEIIERIGKARFITTLDLTKGYWQVALAPEAREKTAFATPEGLFQYKRLPFVLHGAPPTYQWLMDRVLRPHRDYAAAYLDDIVIHGEEWGTHLRRVDAILHALRRAGLTANPKKFFVGLISRLLGRNTVYLLKEREQKRTEETSVPSLLSPYVSTLLTRVAFHAPVIERLKDGNEWECSEI